MVAVLSLARRHTLVQELRAVEGLARVDVICLDKTGTLTYGDPRFDRIEVCAGSEDAAGQALGLLCAGEGNATALALREAFPDTTWRRIGAVPFSSARKWSAVTAEGHGSWVLGAPELLLPDPVGDRQANARQRADTLAAEGRRVLLLAHIPGDDPIRGDADVPAELEPAALVVLAERIREDAAETLRYFTDQGVTLKVISGDNPRTVGAVAAEVGLPGVSGACDAIDARTLPDDLDA